MSECRHPEKSRYATEAAARRAAARVVVRLGVWLRPYTCPGCGFWHLTKLGAPALATPTTRKETA
jgi:hypothetical protein